VRRQFPAPQVRNEGLDQFSASGPLDISARHMGCPGICRQHEPGAIATPGAPQLIINSDIPGEGAAITIDAMVCQDSGRYQSLQLDQLFSNSMFISGHISTSQMSS